MHDYHTVPVPVPHELAPGDLHLWMVPTAAVTNPWPVLTHDERTRAAAFTSGSSGRAFVAGRALVRLVLGSILDQDPVRLVFDRGAHGKPAVADAPWLGFNLSHDRGRLLLGVVAGREVGLDLQHASDGLGNPDVLRRVCTRAEHRHLSRIRNPAARDRRMLALWVRKEAVLKADGRGLAVDPRRVTVGWRRRRVRGLALGVTVVDLSAPNGARAAVGVRGGEFRLRWQTTASRPR